MGEGGHNKFEVVLARQLEVLAILMGGTKGFHPLEGGGGRENSKHWMSNSFKLLQNVFGVHCIDYLG